MLPAMLGVLSCAALALSVSAASPAQTSRIGIAPPRLVVLISIDQFRADYVERFAPYLLPARSGGKLGGFRFLMETGAHFRNAMHNHIPTATGPGHATLMTGSEPAYDGIVSNDWYDRALGRSIYCVDDPNVRQVGGGGGASVSPRNLLVTTVGDELKMATNGRSKVVGVAIKDRAAILMAGHAADTVIWYDGDSGAWVTSSWYAPGGRLPAWVQALDAEKPADRFAGKTWEPLLPDDAYAIARRSPFEKPAENGKPFSHVLPASGKSLYEGLIPSRYGNELTFEAVDHAIDGEQLGRHDVPDVLVVNLSSNDYVGHRYGPNSPEVMDMTVRTDRLLSGLFNELQRKVPGGIDDVAVVVTGDHGVAPIPEESNDVYKTGAFRGFGKTVLKAIADALVAKYGEGKWVLGGLYEQNVYLNRQLAAEKGLKMADVEATAADAAAGVPGVFAAFGRTQILGNGVPPYPWRERVLNGFNSKLGGDLLVLESPGDLTPGGTGTTHGTVWDYDAHVPILLRARGVKPGIYLNRVHTSDIAPTLCRLLGIEYPSGNVGTPLVDTLGR